jgi:signal transduction histidine kinase
MRRTPLPKLGVAGPRPEPPDSHAPKAPVAGRFAILENFCSFGHRRQELNFQPVDIVALVHGMAELLERSIGPSVRIETRFPLGLPWVNADSNQLEMALLNRAVNARDAMPQGGPIIIAARPETVAVRSGRLQPGGYVCLSLTDSGEGMDEDTLARAINPFFTSKERGKGTGLGLRAPLMRAASAAD